MQDRRKEQHLAAGLAQRLDRLGGAAQGAKPVHQQAHLDAVAGFFGQGVDHVIAGVIVRDDIEQHINRLCRALDDLHRGGIGGLRCIMQVQSLCFQRGGQVEALEHLVQSMHGRLRVFFLGKDNRLVAFALFAKAKRQEQGRGDIGHHHQKQDPGGS